VDTGNIHQRPQGIFTRGHREYSSEDTGITGGHREYLPEDIGNIH